MIDKIVKIKFVIFIFLYVVFQMVACDVAYVFECFNQEKLKGEKIVFSNTLNYIVNYWNSPFDSLMNMINSKNPFLTILSIGSLVLAVYIVYIAKTKEYKVETNYTVQGSGRFADIKEIVNNRDIISVPEKMMLAELELSFVCNNTEEGDKGETKQEKKKGKEKA